MPAEDPPRSLPRSGVLLGLFVSVALVFMIQMMSKRTLPVNDAVYCVDMAEDGIAGFVPALFFFNKTYSGTPLPARDFHGFIEFYAGWSSLLTPTTLTGSSRWRAPWQGRISSAASFDNLC